MDGVRVADEKVSIDNFGPGTQGNSNPNIPGTVHGIKVDISDGLVYSFFSSKAPVWGDFYSKDGVAGKGSGPASDADINAAWNSDFLEPDPSNAPQNGLLSDGGGSIYRILRPDSTSVVTTTTPAVPEPSSLLLFGLALGACALRRGSPKA